MSELFIESGIPSFAELCPVGSGTDSAPWDQEEAAVTLKTMDAWGKAAQAETWGQSSGACPVELDSRMGTPFQLPLRRGWSLPRETIFLQLPRTHQ